MDTQIMSWFILALPTYVVLSVWASLTGNMIVPGPFLLMKMALAGPLLAALGMATGCASTGVLQARVWVPKKLEANDNPTAREGPTEGQCM